jgi:hypothetical protein
VPMSNFLRDATIPYLFLKASALFTLRADQSHHIDFVAAHSRYTYTAL